MMKDLERMMEAVKSGEDPTTAIKPIFANISEKEEVVEVEEVVETEEVSTVSVNKTVSSEKKPRETEYTKYMDSKSSELETILRATQQTVSNTLPDIQDYKSIRFDIAIKVSPNGTTCGVLKAKHSSVKSSSVLLIGEDMKIESGTVESYKDFERRKYTKKD